MLYYRQVLIKPGGKIPVLFSVAIVELLPGLSRMSTMHVVYVRALRLKCLAHSIRATADHSGSGKTEAAREK